MIRRLPKISNKVPNTIQPIENPSSDTVIVFFAAENSAA